MEPTDPPSRASALFYTRAMVGAGGWLHHFDPLPIPDQACSQQRDTTHRAQTSNDARRLPRTGDQ